MPISIHGCVKALRLRRSKPRSPADLTSGTVVGPCAAREWVRAVDRLDRRSGHTGTKAIDVLLLSAAQSTELAALVPTLELHCAHCGAVRQCVHTYQQARDLRREMFEAVLRWGRRTGNMLPDCA